eukprot:SAG11_NODE_32307_length_284_cov_2.129730_1_plen_56_part_10
MYFLSVLYREARCTVYFAYVTFGTINSISRAGTGKIPSNIGCNRYGRNETGYTLVV